jgi:Zn finger protein HypA/HybF involved in hydrogenase expression
MHELSLASSILEIARRAVPRGARLCVVRVVAGPMRAIDPDAMQFAWQSVTADAGIDGIDGIELELDLRPWTLRCPECGGEWVSGQLDCACAVCGCSRAFPVGGDQFQVVSIEVDGPPSAKGAVSCDAYR